MRILVGVLAVILAGSQVDARQRSPEFNKQLEQHRKDLIIRANGGWDKRRSETSAEIKKQREILRTVIDDLAKLSSVEGQELMRRHRIEASMLDQLQALVDTKSAPIINDMADMYAATTSGNASAYKAARTSASTKIKAAIAEVKTVDKGLDALEPGYDALVKAVSGELGPGARNPAPNLALMIGLRVALETQTSPRALSLWLMMIDGYFGLVGFEADIIVMNILNTPQG